MVRKRTERVNADRFLQGFLRFRVFLHLNVVPATIHPDHVVRSGTVIHALQQSRHSLNISGAVRLMHQVGQQHRIVRVLFQEPAKLLLCPLIQFLNFGRGRRVLIHRQLHRRVDGETDFEPHFVRAALNPLFIQLAAIRK